MIRIETPPAPSLDLKTRRARHRDAARREVLHQLASITGVAHDSLGIVREMSGKPRLTLGASTVVAFNVSHTDGVSLLAVGPGRMEIGVDVETLVDLPDAPALAARVLTARERERIATPGHEVDVPALLQRWTEKEALLKAAGVGLSRDPHTVGLRAARDGSLAPEGAPDLSAFRVWPLDGGGRVVGAVAVNRTSIRLSTWRVTVP